MKIVNKQIKHMRKLFHSYLFYHQTWTVLN